MDLSKNRYRKNWRVFKYLNAHFMKCLLGWWFFITFDAGFHRFNISKVRYRGKVWVIGNTKETLSKEEKHLNGGKWKKGSILIEDSVSTIEMKMTMAWMYNYSIIWTHVTWNIQDNYTFCKIYTVHELNMTLHWNIYYIFQHLLN